MFIYIDSHHKLSSSFGNAIAKYSEIRQLAVSSTPLLSNNGYEENKHIV